MAWDDGDNKDPWRPRGEQGPTDLDAIVRDLQRKLSGLFGGKGRGRGNGDGGRGPSPRLGSGLIAFGLVILVGLWAVTGFYQVDEAERGVVLRFGKYSQITLPGLRWHLPFPIEKVDVVNTDETLRWQYEGSMLTRDENIVIVDLIVQYRRSDPEAYLFSLRQPDDTLYDVTASAIREVVGKNDLDYILTDGRLDIAAKAQELLQATLDSYNTGLTVYEVNMQEASFPADVQPSVQDVVKAREDRQRLIFEAETYRNQLLPNARGQAVRQTQDAEAYKAQVVADAEGESQRFTQILDAYRRAPEVTRERMYLETLQEIMSSSTKVLVDTKGGNNLLYLPLDRLVEQRSSGAGNQSASSSASQSSAAQSAGSSTDTRLDRGQR
jgi:membrane protease subunit HflK